ncbi:hypothetical protein, partial [Sphingomonas sp. SRS2]|uniref:hypothetical protein n=1 Tax=Sphingomonas sp. SRS2 TaxID=133190 RepID=UPI001F367295
FLIVGMMKGHVGGGSGFWRLQGVGGSVKAKSFHVLICKTLCVLCRNGSLKFAVVVLGFHWGDDGIST